MATNPIKRGLLIKGTKDMHLIGGKETEVLIINDSTVEENDKQLITKGCLTWELTNIGTAVMYLWDSIAVPPGATFVFPNYTNIPIGNNVPFKYAGDYTLTRDINTATPPASIE